MMRVARRETLTSIIVLSMFIVTITYVPEVIQFSLLSTDKAETVQESPQIPEFSPPNQNPDDYEQVNEYHSADEVLANGILNPLPIEQRGYSSSGSIFARTDMFSNLEYNLPIDRAHNWLGSNASISIWNLTRLYVVNGTLDEGIPGENIDPAENVSYYPYGWDSNSTNMDAATTQKSAYYQSDSYYVTVEDQGKTLGTGINERSQHIAGTQVIWSQIISNAPYSDEFVFSTSYLYKWGPLNPSLGTAFTLVARINGTEVWSMSLASLAAHNVWYNTGNVTVSLPGAGKNLFFEIGLKVNSTIALYHSDYDILDAHYITAFLDDISLIGVTSPALEAVDLQFHAGTEAEAITGTSGTGSASIQNSTYWSTPAVHISVSSNTSVSFSYLSTLLSHRFTETTWKTDLTALGVTFTADFGTSVSIDFYAYVGYFGYYENPTMHIMNPVDWVVATIYDSSPLNVTSQCIITSNEVTIPGILLDNLGWWHFECKSPNYAKSVTAQMLDPISTNWSDAAIFRISNTTRANITIGSSAGSPSLLENASVFWYLPSGAMWLNETPLSGSNGEVLGSGHILASGSSPAGQWWIQALWTNGTEVAYGHTWFEVHHTAGLVADPVQMTTDAGLVVTGIVRYTDGDTGANLLDPSANITGYWSASSVTFIPNAIHNWWEGTFDTSLVGEGEFIITINASRLYYDNASCQITLQSIRVARLSSPNAPWTADEWGHTTELTFNYEYYDYTTSSWGPISNDTTVSVSMNWTAGFWSVGEGITPGVYNVNLSTGVKNSGTWLLNITFSKTNYQTKTIFLTLIVSPVTSSLSILGDISARVNLDEEQSVELAYRGSGGNPISGANVVIDSISPSTGMSYTIVNEVSGEPGNYTASFTPHNAGVFSIRFLATDTNSEPAIAVFVLVVNDVAANLHISGPSSVEIGLTDIYNTTFRFTMANGTGISLAQINITYSGGIPGALSIDVAEQAMGNYSVEFSSIHAGTYLITIAASKPYYQSDSDAFFLIVGAITTNMISLNGTAGVVSFEKAYQLYVKYTNGSNFGLDGANVTIASATPETGLNWEDAIPQGGGIYSIRLTPINAGTYNLLIQATLDNHDPGFVFFSITASAKGSNLIILNSTATISYDRNFTVYMLFQDEDLIGLENATIEPINHPVGLIFSNTTSLGDGYYSITIRPTNPGNYLLQFIASAVDYFDSISAFILSVINIPTRLGIENGLSSASIDFLEEYELLVLYERTDSPSNISNAIIQLNFTSAENPAWSIYQLPEGYLIQFNTNHIGRWEFSITAAKSGYQSATGQFTLFIREIGTSISGSQPSEALAYGKSYSYSYRYTLSNTPSVGIDGCNLSYTGPGSDWLTIHDLGNGFYNITVTPEGLGIYDVQLTFSKLGYQIQTSHFQFTANAARLRAIMNPLVWYRLSPLNITLNLFEESSTNPVSDAIVTYRLYHDQNLEMEGFLNETKSGTYTVIINPNWYDGLHYSLYISVEKTNYALGSSINPLSIEQVTTEDVAVALFIATVVPPVAISIALLSAAIIGQIVYRKRKKSRLETDLANKRRFDDADNIIGVIILHKKSGIPIYSRMMKGGFEEGIVAAFITAVTHFREEFEMFDEESMAVVPISDIIRAVQTRNLICAIITVRSASIEHNRNMEEYAKQVARFLDDLLEGRPDGVIDKKIVDMLDYIFNTTMNGFLLQFYKVATSEKFPKRYELLDEVLHDTDTRHCTKPVLLAKSLSSYGVTEARGCTLVLEAIQKELIVLCNEEETDSLEFKFSDFFAQPDRTENMES